MAYKKQNRMGGGAVIKWTPVVYEARAARMLEAPDGDCGARLRATWDESVRGGEGYALSSRLGRGVGVLRDVLKAQSDGGCECSMHDDGGEDRSYVKRDTTLR